jgi:hypothetical protein
MLPRHTYALIRSICSREWVQVELGLDLVEQVGAGFVQPDPNNVAGTVCPFAGFAETNIRDAVAIDIGAGCSDTEVLVGWSNSICLSHYEA